MFQIDRPEADWNKSPGAELGINKFKSDSKSGSFKQRKQRPILDISKLSKDVSLHLESASFDENNLSAADKGPKETQQGGIRQNNDDGNMDYHIGLVLEDRCTQH
ncbi:hypothetical protein ILYODFUR_021571 [Ilyodon furcidens]|uniref:Uncharacterized protein n=1 Tax=Ilyodon furcidens TaxID=33524 RepID=A0ABV0V5Z4_9TELE